MYLADHVGLSFHTVLSLLILLFIVALAAPISIVVSGVV